MLTPGDLKRGKDCQQSRRNSFGYALQKYVLFTFGG
jgi:hypothetical protein